MEYERKGVSQSSKKMEPIKNAQVYISGAVKLSAEKKSLIATSHYCFKCIGCEMHL